jgi:hypothetical protein
MKRLLLLLPLLCFAPYVKGQTINAASCSNTDVQTALSNVTVDGTIVNVPSCSLTTWTSQVTYNGAHSVILQGQSTCTGTGTQTPSCTDNTNITGAEFYLSISTTLGKSLRITGFTFQVSSTFNGLIHLTGGTTQLRIDHNHFFHMQAVAIIDGPLGVADHNFFDFSNTQQVFNGLRLKQYSWNGFGWGDGSWADNTNFGSSKFFFFEDNTFLNGFADDCDTGARFVMRHNYFHDATMQGHEMAGRFQGCRAMEVYQNTFFSDLSGVDTADAILIRTGTGLFWGNTVTSYGDMIKANNDRSDTQHGFTAPNFSGCNSADGSFSCYGYACNSQGTTYVLNGQTFTFCNPGGSASMPLSPSGFDGNTDNFGYPALEQVGRGKGNLFPQFDFTNSSFWTTEPTWPANKLEPLYIWLNNLSGTPSVFSSIFGSNLFQQNRDWYTDNAASTGVRTGTSLPATCSPLQAFWNTSTNTLYQCQTANTWTVFYTPFAYPHPLTQNLGWVYIQDGVITSCNAGTTSCTFQNNNVVPTTAGTVWIIRLHSGGTGPGPWSAITSVSGGGATCHLCPGGNCHLTNAAFNDNQDLAYCIGGAAGTTNITVNVSPATVGFWGGNFMEILPPLGSTPSFDAAATNTSSSCTTCTAPNLTLTGIDAVIAVLSGNGAAAWNSFSSPYVTDIASNGIGLNLTSGTGPSVQVTGSGGDFTSIAFTSSFGSFNPPPNTETVVHYTTSQPTCGPTCSITIPATAAGNLLYLEAADLNSGAISGVCSSSSSCTGTDDGWVVLAGCKILLTVPQNSWLSCAYNLSAAAGRTSVKVTMSGNAPTQLGLVEVATTGIPFTLDHVASKQNGNNIDPPGISFCASGCDLPPLTGPDVVFEAGFLPGGPSGITYDPMPLGGANWFFNQAALAFRTNVQSDEKPVWAFGIANAPSTVTGVAFSSAPSAPIACVQPVISNVVATPASNGTQTTITWTTSVAADSLVVFGINNAGNLTSITDAGGVTTHSVTLSNLLPSTQYGFGIRSRAIANGAACGTPFYGFVDNTRQFTTSAAPAGTADYYIVPDVSPKFVTQGFGVYLGLRVNTLVGTVPNNTVSVVVTGLPNFVSLTWTDQQILGIAGTVSTTTVTNDTLKWFQLANTELRVLTNQGGTTTPGAYTLTFTASGTGVPTHVVTMPLTVDAAASPFGIAFPFGTPSSYPAIPDLATYKSTATTYGPIHCAQDLDVSPRTIRPNDNANLTPVGPSIQKGSWYYDGVRVYWNVQALTQDGNNYEQCRANIRAVYRDGYIIPNSGAVQVFTMFPEGPYLDVVKQSDNTSLNELNLMDAHTYAPGNEVQVSVRYLQREVAYSLKNDIFASVLGQNNVRFTHQTSFWLGYHLDHVLGHIDQICRSQNADFWQSFMTGLEADAVIDYYENIGHDARIPSAIKCLADYIFTNAWNTISDDQAAFQYDNWRGATNFGIANGGASSMVPLNLLIAPMYAWLFSQTGLTQYQTEGDLIWDHGVLLDGAAGGITNQLNQAYPGGNSGKLFSQQYYWGPKYVTYRSVPVPSISFSSSTVNFQNVPVGIPANPQTVTLTNSSVGTLTISNMTVSAPFTFSTSPATNCGGSLAPAATCTITFNYTPVSPVVSSGTFSMTSNSATSPDTISVNGTGTGTPAPAVNLFAGNAILQGTVQIQ